MGEKGEGSGGKGGGKWGMPTPLSTLSTFDRRDANLAMTFMFCLVTLDMTSETRIGL